MLNKIRKEMKMSDKIKEDSLKTYFYISFLIPIIVTLLVTLKEGLQTGLVTNQISASALVVIMSMVHAPTIAAVIAVCRDEGFDGVRKLFQQLKYWRFSLKWYLLALSVFPIAILAGLLMMTLFSPRYMPVLSLSILAVGTLISPLWEEVGWTGYATPRLLKRYSPLKAGIYLGVIHLFWHFAADYWGASAFYGKLYLAHFFLCMAGLIVLRVITLWIYIRTKSLVLAWLTHVSYTGGQMILVPLTFTALETVLWNSAFVLVLLFVVMSLVTMNKDFREFWKSGIHEGTNELKNITIGSSQPS
jgi:membrane protease YdiL (CAAX protease family)